MDFKRIGGSFILVTILVGIVAVLVNIVANGPISRQQQPITDIALVLRILAYLSLAVFVLCAIMTAVREQQLTRAILPALFGLLSIVLVVTNSDFGFSLVFATFVSTVVVFGGEKTEPVWQKNAVMLFGLLAVLAFNVGLAASVTSINTVSLIGVVLGISGFLMALVYPIQRMQWGWLALLLGVAVTGLPLMLISGRTDIGLLLLPMAAITAVRGLVWSNMVFDRRSFGTLAGLALLMIIGGGTLINSVFSTVNENEHPLTKPTFLAGTDMYLTAGVLCLVAWIFSFLYAARHSMWGWFVASLLLPAIGAILLGFFGPTPEDFRQGKASAAAKRQAGA